MMMEGRSLLPECVGVATCWTDQGLRHALVWERKDASVADVRMYAGIIGSECAATWPPLQKDGYSPRTQIQVDVAGGPWHSAIWWKPAEPIESKLYYGRIDETTYVENMRSDRF